MACGPSIIKSRLAHLRRRVALRKSIRACPLFDCEIAVLTPAITTVFAVCAIYLIAFSYLHSDELRGPDMWANLKKLQQTTLAGRIHQWMTYLLPVLVLLLILALTNQI